MIDRWLEKDVTLRLVAVALAIVLWLRVVSSQSPVVSLTMPEVKVEAVGLAAGLAAAEIKPEHVEVSLRAPRVLLERLGPGKVRAQVELQGAKAGRLTLPVTVKVPRGVQVAGCSPARVVVTVDYLSERQVPVHVTPVGVVGNDYRVEAPVAQPQEVLVFGPRTQVARVRYAAAEVDITGATADFSRSVTLRAVDGTGADVTGVELRPPEVEVRFSLVKLPPAKEVRVEPKLRGGPPLGYRVLGVRLSPSLVTIRGPQDLLDGITAVTTKPIDVQGLTGDAEKEAGLDLPSGVVMVEPSSVLVYLQVGEDVSEADIAGLKVEVRGLLEKQQAESQPAEVSLTVRGRKDLLEKATAQVWVEVQPTAGEYRLKVQVALPPGLELVKVTPAEVIVKVSPPPGEG